MSELAAIVSRIVQRVVIDKTGLTGNFDFELKWTPDQTPQNRTAADPSPPDVNSPSIFTALQEQLGLRLESAKNSVEVLVVDHVERPTPE